jgi:hypothetical protein
MRNDKWKIFHISFFISHLSSKALRLFTPPAASCSCLLLLSFIFPGFGVGSSTPDRAGAALSSLKEDRVAILTALIQRLETRSSNEFRMLFGVGDFSRLVSSDSRSFALIRG